MANGKSDYQAALDAAATARKGSANADSLSLVRKTARFVLTGLGNENDAAPAYHVLGRLQARGARVIPEACRVRLAAGTPDIKVQLKVAPSAGSPVALTAVSGRINAPAAGVALVAATGGDTVALGAEDELRLYLTAGGGSDGTGTTVSFPTSASLVVEVAYDVAAR